MKRLYGMVNAMITPMTEKGELDTESLKAFTKMLGESGVHCLYPNGTNGESLSLAKEEREEVAALIHQVNAGRCVLYIQCGAATVQESYSHVLHTANVLHADGAGLMTPVFFPMDDAAMELYYENILDQIGDFPLYIYNISSRTGNNVSVAVLKKLVEKYDNLLGMKFSSPDLMQLQAYVRCSERKPDVLIGCDSLALNTLMCGGAGYVSGPGAVFPEIYSKVYNCWKAKDFEGANAWQERILDIQKRMNGVPEIPAIKYMLYKKGIISTPVCRAPFRPLDKAERAQLDALLSYIY